MSRAWAYRATNTNAKRAETLALLVEDGFLCRTAFARTSDGRRQFIPHISRIEPGDEVHVYYADGDQPHWLGGFLVLPPTAALTGLSDEAPAVGLVGNGEALAAKLEDCGYARDPVLVCFTGFSVNLLREAAPAEVPQFVGRNAIVALLRSAPDLAPAETPSPPKVSSDATEDFAGAVYGLDWSGARRAGDKIWVALSIPPNASSARLPGRGKGWGRRRLREPLRTGLAAWGTLGWESMRRSGSP